jgi:hypothetical protein
VIPCALRSASGAIELFMHDSVHSGGQGRLELVHASAALQSNGLLVAGDNDRNRICRPLTTALSTRVRMGPCRR